jgi:predicted secreted acid phosphatase
MWRQPYGFQMSDTVSTVRSIVAFAKRAIGKNSRQHLSLLAAALIAFLGGTGMARAEDRNPSVSMPQPPNLGLLKAQVRAYYECCYAQDIAKTASEAKAYVEQRAPGAAKPALVLDIDETSLSNWRQIIQNDFGFIAGGACDLTPHTACGALAWELAAKGEVIQPTLELFNAAKAKNVAVFFITGRVEGPVERAATAENLSRAGYSGWTELVMKQPPDNSTAEIYKSAVRARIASQGYTIIANMGDQESDLAGGYSEKVFKLPNPFYFLP